MSYITRYEPISFLNEVNKMIEHAIRPTNKTDSSYIETSRWIPAVDIKEDKKQFVILADLPGVDKNDINISMENNILTIKGSRPEETTGEQISYCRSERIRGNFHRQFTLPDTADESNIEAKVQKGVLEITIPKKETAKPRLIQIQSDE